MSVDTTTGEIVDALTPEAAERITQRIELRLDSVGDSLEGLEALVQEARDGQAHVGTGFKSWPAYVDGRFGERLERIAKFDRGAVVYMLSNVGMSNRAIAGTIGVSHDTVNRDVGAQVDDHRPPESTFTLDSGGGFVAEGEEIKLDTRSTYDAETGELLDEQPINETPEPFAEGEAESGSGQIPQGEARGERPDETPPPRPAVTGIDGKAYPKPKKRKASAPKRKALTDSFFRAAYDAAKKVESLHRLIEDDRFPQNAEKVAASHRNDLIRTRDLLEQVIDSLPEKEITA